MKMKTTSKTKRLNTKGVIPPKQPFAAEKAAVYALKEKIFLEKLKREGKL